MEHQDETETLEVQEQESGAGTLFERRYWIDVRDSKVTPIDLMTYIRTHFNEFSPDLLARFHKTEPDAAEQPLEVDDEFHIQILGPWNGDVRVTEVDEQSFEFVTLEGHPEAGTIRFRASAGEGPGDLHFEIRSLARARDGLVALMHEKLGVGMWVQEKMWLAFCRRVLEFSEGEAVEPEQSATVDREQGTWWEGR